MPAGLFDEGDTGMPDLPGAGAQGMPQGIAGGGLMGGAMMGGALGGGSTAPYSPEEMRTAFAQILAKNAPQGSGQPSPEDLWSLQGQHQMGAPPAVPSLPAIAGPYGQNEGVNMPMSRVAAPGSNPQQQEPEPMPNAYTQGLQGMNAPTDLPPSIGAFPGAQDVRGGPTGPGAYELPKSIRFGRR